MTSQEFALENMRSNIYLGRGVFGKIVGSYISLPLFAGANKPTYDHISDLPAFTSGSWEAVVDSEGFQVIVRSKQFLNNN